MGMAQFAKVVLLPQGDFAAFLRATPDDRREVLERLFDISAFSDVEAWLAQARRTAGADLEVARSALASVVARADDVLAQAGSAADTSQVPPESVAAHLHAVADQLDARVSTTMAAFDTASGADRAATEALAAARRLDELRTRGLSGRSPARRARGRRPEPPRAGVPAGGRGAGGRPGRSPHRARPGCRRRRRVRAPGASGPAPPCRPVALAALPDERRRRGAGPRARPRRHRGGPGARGRRAGVARPAAGRARRAGRAAHGAGRAGRCRAGGRARPSARCSLPRSRPRPRVPGGCPSSRCSLDAARARVAVLDAAEHDLARRRGPRPATRRPARGGCSTAAPSCSTCDSCGSTAWPPSSPGRCRPTSRARSAARSNTPLPQRGRPRVGR